MVTAELKYTVPSIFVPSGFLPKFSATLELNREMPAYSSRERLAVLITVTLVTTIYAMTITIANVALPRIQGALSATTDEIALVVTFNIIATAVATPMSGWLAAQFSRRSILLGGLVLFSIATFLCGTAESLTSLVVFRVLQGAFSAPLAPICQSLLYSVYPRSQYGFAMAVFGTGVVLGPVMAPTIGGYLTEYLSWRWVFFMILPLAAVAFVAVSVFIRDLGQREGTPLDWTGFLSLAVAIASFQYMLDRGERNDWFESGQIIVLAGIGAISFYIFIAHTMTSDRPFLNPKLLQDRNFALGLVIALTFGMLNLTPMSLLPILLQNLRGYPDSIIGLLLGARGVGTFIGFLFMIKGNQIDPRYTLTAGFLCQAVSGWYMAQFSLDLTTFDVMWTSCLQGFGVGMIWVPLTVVTFTTLDDKYTAEGTGIFHLIRNFGSSLFISISIAVVLRTSRMNYSSMVENVTPINPAIPFQDSFYGVWSITDTGALAALSGEIGRQSAMIGYSNAFYLFSIAAFAACPLVFLAKLKR